MLNGKANESFLDWFVDKYMFKGKSFSDINIYQKGDVGTFLRFPTTKNAYIIEWFDSVGIYIETSMHNCKKFWCDVCFFETDEDFNADYSLVDENGHQLYFDNRESAIKMGIDTANQIYNSRP